MSDTGSSTPADRGSPDPDASDPTRDAAAGAAAAVPDAAGLLAACAHHERALAEDDLSTLDRLFADGGTTLRAESGGALVGHGEISAHRAGRGAPQRWVRRVHVRAIGDHGALTVTETERRDGATGVQTQVWARAPGASGTSAWAVTAAHVSGAPAPPEPAPLLDDAVWSVAPSGDGALVPGADDGALAWVRLAVKDVVAVAGHRVGAGVPAWLAAASPEPSCAPALQRLVDAGADVVGIAQTDELAFSIAGQNRHYGTPDNPAAPGRTTGGSTSGPAAAVASGAADLGLGTDTAGSLRVPASYCGLYALRPTHGAVDTTGVLPLAPSFDTVGLLARDGRLLHAAAEVLLPPRCSGDERPSALVRSPALMSLADPATALAVDAALAALAVQTGLPVLEPGQDPTDDDVASWAEAFRQVQAAQAWRVHGAFVRANPGALDPAVEARFRAGAEVDEAAERAARDVLAAATSALEALLTAGGDAGPRVLCLPSTSGPAPLADALADEVAATRTATLRLTCLASLAGMPALGLPWGRAGTLPVGLGVVAPAGHDRSLLRLLDELVPQREVPS